MFYFESDVDKDVLRRTLVYCGDPDIKPEDLTLERFEKELFDFIRSVYKRPGCSLNIEQLKRYGFVSDDAVKAWIQQEHVLSVLPIMDALPTKLFERLTILYQGACEITKDIDWEDDKALATLPIILDFIKRLSVDEVTILDKRHRRDFSSYFRDGLESFRDDLNTLSYHAFERKHSGCYAGMLQNVIGTILDAERLVKMIELARLKSSPVNNIGFFGGSDYQNKGKDEKTFDPIAAPNLFRRTT